MRLLAFAVFLVAGLTDLWDGYLARKSGRETNFGKILDPIADKFLVLCAMFALVHLDVYPLWAASAIAAREFLITVIRLRCLVHHEVLAAEFSGKLKTFVQIVSLTVAYLFLMARDHLASATPAETLFIVNQGAVLLAVGITLYSGLQYLKTRQRIHDLAELIATALYVGYLRPAPGTYGSLAGMALYFTMPKTPHAYAMAVLVFTGLAVWASHIHGTHTGRKDPTEVVVDEVIGILVALFLIPSGWLPLITAFVLFRVFDVAKPYPLRKLEYLKSGWGIVLDDLGAGIYANLVTQLLFRFLLSG